MDRAKYDSNLKPTLIAVSMNDESAIIALEADPDTGRLLVSATIDNIDPLDIRNLDHATDSVEAWQGGSWSVAIDQSTPGTTNKVSLGTDTIKVDGSATVQPVSATDLDIRNLSSAQDSVEAKQATHDNLNLNANLQVNNSDNASTNPAYVSVEKVSSASTSDGVTIGNTSTTVIAANASRKAVMIVNDSDETIYLKYGTGAEMNKGIRLNSSGGAVREELYKGIITAICTSGSKNVTVTEL